MCHKFNLGGRAKLNNVAPRAVHSALTDSDVAERLKARHRVRRVANLHTHRCMSTSRGTHEWTDTRTVHNGADTHCLA